MDDVDFCIAGDLLFPHQFQASKSQTQYQPAGDRPVRYPMSTQLTLAHGPSHKWRAGLPATSNFPSHWREQNPPLLGDVSGQLQSGPPHSSGAGVPSGHAPCAGEISERCTHVHVC